MAVSDVRTQLSEIMNISTIRQEDMESLPVVEWILAALVSSRFLRYPLLNRPLDSSRCHQHGWQREPIPRANSSSCHLLLRIRSTEKLCSSIGNF